MNTVSPLPKLAWFRRRKCKHAATTAAVVPRSREGGSKASRQRNRTQLGPRSSGRVPIRATATLRIALPLLFAALVSQDGLAQGKLVKEVFGVGQIKDLQIYQYVFVKAKGDPFSFSVVDYDAILTSPTCNPSTYKHAENLCVPR